jgi:hypothetical protein
MQSIGSLSEGVGVRDSALHRHKHKYEFHWSSIGIAWVFDGLTIHWSRHIAASFSRRSMNIDGRF